MTKRIIGTALAAVLVLGLAGVALSGAAERPSTELEAADLVLAADPGDPADPANPADPADPAKPAGPKREELRACVKAKVDGGAERRTAVRECADQLGIKPGKAGRPGRNGPKGGPKRLGRAAHAELVVPKKGAEGQWETVVVDRGKVKTATADSITVERPDGPTVTLKVVAGTKVRGAATVAELAPGRTVTVVSAGGEARSVVARG